MPENRGLGMRNIADIKNALRDIVDYYQHPPKNLESLLQKYAEALQYYPLDAVKNAIRAVAMDAGRFFPTISEIRALIGNSHAKTAKSCEWCDQGRIFAKHRENGLGYAFRCRCEAGSQLGASCPQWNSAKHAHLFDRLK